MKAAIIQHEKSVSAGTTINWLQSRQINFKIFPLFEIPLLPSLNDFDILIICGGTMNVDQEDLYPWLAGEKKLIHNAIQSEKTIIGLCLGAQLIAESLNASVIKHTHPEIGWHSVEISSRTTPNLKSIMVFQWHEYCFDLPAQAKPLATNHNCVQQGFTINETILAFQFHPEATTEWILNCAANPALPLPCETVQSSEEIKRDLKFQPALQDWYFSHLDQLAQFVNAQ